MLEKSWPKPQRDPIMLSPPAFDSDSLLKSKLFKSGNNACLVLFYNDSL